MRSSICTFGNILVIVLGMVYMVMGVIGMLMTYQANPVPLNIDIVWLAFWAVLFAGGCAAFFTKTYWLILSLRTRWSMRYLISTFD